MNLVIALDELSKARVIVAEGEGCVAEQRAMIDTLDREGFDTLDAILFLEHLEEMQEAYVAHRDRLERQVMVLVRPATTED